MRLYHFIRRIAARLLPLFIRFRPHGLANIPAEGPFIIASNHIHALDPVVIAIIVPRHVSFMAKEELMHSRILAWLVRKMGAFTVKRGKADVQAIRQALKVLGAGEVLGIFPEGTRGKTGEVQSALAGTAMLAARAKAPVVPVALYGSYRFGGTLHVHVGEPLYIKGALPGKPTAAERAAGTDIIMQRIADLLADCKKENEQS